MYARHKYKNNNYLIPCFIFLDCFLFGGIVVLWYFMTFWNKTNVFRASQIYIPCVDQVYYNYDKDPDGGLLPDTVVYVLGFSLPVIMILFGEAILAIYQLQGGRHHAVHEKELRVCKFRFHPLLRRSIRYIGVFSLGAFITLILVRFGQLVIGQPKPHYFNICDGPTECTDTLSVIQLTCGEEGVRESLPNMHAALTSYSSVFIGLYVTILLQPLKTVRSVRPLFCLCIFSLPYMVGIERVRYYEANWSDVITGWILGSVISLYLVYYILNQFKGAETVWVPPPAVFSHDTILSNPHMDKTLEMNRMRGSDVPDANFKEPLGNGVK